MPGEDKSKYAIEVPDQVLEESEKHVIHLEELMDLVPRCDHSEEHPLRMFYEALGEHFYPETPKVADVMVNSTLYWWLSNRMVEYTRLAHPYWNEILIDRTLGMEMLNYGPVEIYNPNTSDYTVYILDAERRFELCEEYT